MAGGRGRQQLEVGAKEARRHRKLTGVTGACNPVRVVQLYMHWYTVSRCLLNEPLSNELNHYIHTVFW